jgi:hypothetical protein
MTMDVPVEAWYHGTRRGFRAGGVLLPRASHTGVPTTAPLNAGQEPPSDAGQWVYVTRDLDLAWVYAWHAVGRGKPKVLRVNPVGTLERDPEHSVRMDAWRCEFAPVRQVLLEPTMTEAEARDGWIKQ